MAVTLDDVAKLALALPEVTEGTRWRNRTWFAGPNGFAWERPLSKADVKRLGDAPIPGGPLLALITEDVGERDAIVAEGRPGVFVIEHFSGYPAYLVQLDKVTKKALRTAIEDAWLAAAPPELAEAHLKH
jgi:hypothetical protein